jgi:Tol biopolymer transport system component
MTDLEERIRQTLRDPRRELPNWPDPMRRVRRAARRQNAGLAGATAILLAAVAVPLAVLTSLGAHSSGGNPSATRTRSAAAATAAPYPAWTTQLGGEVAYQCGDVICLMHPNGTGKRLVPGNGPLQLPQLDPAWSPSGRQLSFRGYYGQGDGEYDLYAVNWGGCHLTRLTHGLNGTSSSWSPTGRQIAFSVPFGIYVINASGSGLHRLIVNATNYSYGVDAPAWSVSNRIAFVRYMPALRVGEIYTANADGSSPTALTHGAPGFGQPSWSPDGRSIAFVANPNSVSAIEVAGADGTGAHRVSPLSWTSYSPTWTSGGKIVFLRQTSAPTATSGASTSAYIINRDGTGLRLLYANLNATQIAWGRTTIQTSC